jgi:cyclic pyranopterin phosphate synthase
MSAIDRSLNRFDELNGEALVDPFGRIVSYVRVSVTDRCDYRCVYCMSEDMNFLPKRDILSLEELDRLCSTFISLGTHKVRLTGGEPLVRRNVMSLFHGLSRHLASGALDELTLTTNGSQLARFARELADCGVKRINVSLDTLDPDKFRTVTRWGDLKVVFAGVDAAAKAGLKVKINIVALRDFNDYEAVELVRWAHGRGFDASFIEVMPLGVLERDRIDQFLPLTELRSDLERVFTLTPSAHSTGGPALLRRQGDWRSRRIHNATYAQLLRELQSRSGHLHRHPLHVPRSGGRGRFARAIAPLTV